MLNVDCSLSIVKRLDIFFLIRGAFPSVVRQTARTRKRHALEGIAVAEQRRESQSRSF